MSRDEKPVFVSRRGKQIGVHELDMKGIDIESSHRGAHEPPQSKASIRRLVKIKIPSTPFTKKSLIIIAAIVTVLIILPLLVAELVAEQYRTGIKNAKNDLSSYVTQTVLPAQKKKSITSEQIQTFGTRVNDIATHMCRGGLLDNAAQVYPRAKNAYQDCKMSQREYAALVTSLSTYRADVQYMERLDAVVKPVATPITDQYAVIDSHLTTWKEVESSLKKLSPTDRTRAAHTALMSYVATAVESWSKLNQANSAQSGDEFRAAEASINESYAAIRRTSEEFKIALLTAQSDVTQKYSAIE